MNAPISLPKRATSRFAELDGLRGIAAVWVVIYHYIGGPFFVLGRQENGERINLEGLFGVHLFFMISGFVIFMTVNNTKSVLDFIMSRFARLYPVSCLSVLLMAAIVANFGSLSCHCTFTINQIIANLTMLNIYIGVGYVVTQGWSLAYEIAFYFWIAVMFATGRLDKIEKYGCAWVAVSFVLMRLVPAIGGPYMPWRLGVALDLEYSGLFFSGILFYKVWSEGVNRFRAIGIVLCYVEFVVTYSIEWGAIMACIFLIFWLCVAGYCKFLKSGPLVFLGTISYSLYMTHNTAAEVSQRLLMLTNMPPLLDFAISIGAAVGLATVVTFAFERPVNRAIREAYRRARPISVRTLS